MSVPVNQIICGDNVETLRTLPDACVDSCVTDPPYGLEFMGKEWDRGVPGVELWREVLRVLKPGGHLLAFAGTRTQHRMATAIEDAGFEIRDMIAWVYGSGFPKSLDVSKAIDKAAGAEREKEWKRYTPKTMAGAYDQRPWLDEARANGGRMVATGAPATDAARQWQGWGTALKPSLEPITVARKPLCGTVAENVLQHGTGGINVDGCRVGHEEVCRMMAPSQANIDNPSEKCRQAGRRESVLELKPGGRWPANLIHDGSDEVVGLFPQAAGAVGMRGKTGHSNSIYGIFARQEERSPGVPDTGSASRFFYCAKAGPDERRDSKHPTIKPVALMRYLVRLVTPPGGLVLDPFGGSGTTAEAARLEHCRFLLIELSPEYCADAAERLRQGVLF
jgi:site-specific DNA-methyltransferase (adenine-specific)